VPARPIARLAAALVVTALVVVPVTLPAQPAAAPARPAAVAGHVKEFGTMWTFDAPPLAYWKARYGFDATPEWLEHARLSAVRIPGCSASFVSDQGLVMTNHHCARQCISAASPPDTNYQRVGFVARSTGEEKKCPGMTADQLQAIEDVTAEVRGAVTATTTARQVAQRDSAIAAIRDRCSDGTGLTCQVVPLYQGGIYSLYKFRRYADVRLVMAPEEEISFFGGDPDNFTYPRYDLDVTFLRVYENDRPLEPAHWFKWSAAGAAEGELVFVIGNPGSTGRLLTVAQMEYLRDVQYPANLAQYKRQIAIYSELAGRSEELKRQYENTIFSLENTQKAVTGYRAGLLDSTIMARKRAFERDVRARVAADPALRRRYGTAWTDIATALKERTALDPKVRHYQFIGSTMLNWAGQLVLLAAQPSLPDSLRYPPYRGNGPQAIRASLTREVPVNRELEKMLLAARLTVMRQDLPATDPVLVVLLAGRSPEVAAEALIEGTKLDDVNVRKQLLEGGPAAIAASTDPLIRVAREINRIGAPVVRRAFKLEETVSRKAELVGQAQFAAYGTALPPDATFTLRISDGEVRGYPMNGTVAPYRTSFYGLYARSAEFGNVPPWRLPARWEQARGSLDLAAPLDFVSTNDIIGGNSGSPVINRNGEVVGLIFDGNIESLPNRFIFTDEVARSVSVHSVGILAALRGAYGADRLADELAGRGGKGR